MTHARNPRRKQYRPRPAVIPMLVKSQYAIGPLEDWLRQIEIHETVDSVQGEAILRSHGDGFAYPAAGAVDGVADFFEMWATRHRKTLDVSALRQVAVRLANGAPLGIAGLWDRWRDAAGQLQESYTMLTINADEDPLFRDFHQAGKEKRMVVILPEGAYGDWLTEPADATRDFLVPFPADRLVATPMK
ncbi:SOS response-associated peptidase family protein [Achromobacter insuavis]|uniref:SOS response-associated peptidase family protein n=1 Tax=Achromobacter insuavis TaxID=1287735 RepID=UPI003B99C81B